MCLIGCPDVTRREVVAGLALLPAMACAEARPSGIRQDVIQFERAGVTIDAFLALPQRTPSSIVAVMHGNAAIPADVQDTAIWAASLGYAGIAVNPTARYPDPTKIPRPVLLGTQYGEDYLADNREAIALVRREKRVGLGKTAVFGYCGGGYVGLMWAASQFGSDLSAIVGAHVATHALRSDAEDYHRPPGIDYLRRSRVPLQLHQGGADDYTPPEDIEELRRMAAAGHKTLELFVYPGAVHGFAMSTHATYRPDYAKLVRVRAARFLRRYLK